MTQNPLVSVIMPAFNSARFVGQAVQTVLAQTYPQVELIVVNDGSTDETETVLAPYANRIQIINQANQGVSAARNTGIRVAQGQYIAFLDADDLMMLDKVETQVAVLESRPDVGLVYSGWQYVAENDLQVVGEMRPRQEGNVLADLLLRRMFLVPGAVIVRRELFTLVGLFDVNLTVAEDTDLWTRLAYAGCAFAAVPLPLLQYRTVVGSLTTHPARQFQNEQARLDKFFAQPDLPADVLALKDQAYAILHYEFATKFFRQGDLVQGQDYLYRATLLCPALAQDADWLVEWLAAYALSPDVADARQFVDMVLTHLPSSAKTLARLRPRLYGHVHIAAAFQAYHNHQYQRIRPHILPALFWYPRALLNRGFLRIMVKSLTG